MLKLVRTPVIGEYMSQSIQDYYKTHRIDWTTRYSNFWLHHFWLNIRNHISGMLIRWELEKLPHTKRRKWRPPSGARSTKWGYNNGLRIKKGKYAHGRCAQLWWLYWRNKTRRNFGGGHNPAIHRANIYGSFGKNWALFVIVHQRCTNLFYFAWAKDPIKYHQAVNVSAPHIL